MSSNATDAQAQGGPSVHVIAKGECIESIAFEYGLTPELIWEDPNNQELRNTRERRDVLLAGDEVFIPQVRTKGEPVTTSKATVFIAKRALRNVRLQLTRDVPAVPPNAKMLKPNEYEDVQSSEVKSEPWADVDVQIVGDGFTWSGTTDTDGKLRAEVPMACNSAELIVAAETDEERRFELQFGLLDPLDTPSGVAQRLSNLGYRTRASNTVTPELTDALKAFQRAKGLEATGEVDTFTRAALQ